VCGLCRAQGDKECEFVGLASKPWSAGFLIWPENQGRQVSQFGPQNRQLRFSDLAHKIIMTVSWFWPQNQAGYDVSVAPQN
jgi:hypothetical protein